MTGTTGRVALHFLPHVLCQTRLKFDKAIKLRRHVSYRLPLVFRDGPSAMLPFASSSKWHAIRQYSRPVSRG